MKEELQKKIQESIAKHKPRPRWQFLTWHFAKEFLLVALWVAMVLLLGMVLYFVSERNPWRFLPPRGLPLWHGFFAFPWELIVIVIVGIWLIYTLSRRIGTLYRLSSHWLILILATSLFLGYGLAEISGLNRGLAHQPGIERLYDHQGMLVRPPARGTWLEGKVVAIEPDLMIEDKDGVRWTVLVDANIQYPDGNDLEVGQEVSVNGIKTANDHTLRAFAIRPSDGGRQYRPPMPLPQGTPTMYSAPQGMPTGTNPTAILY